MAHFYSTLRTEELSFATATERNLTWDVFVSHTTSDDALAGSVAECLRRQGLTAWVDSDFLSQNDDGPSMASHIAAVIKRSFCLLAVVTNATSNSWWVPFEIGVASTSHRFLSTYGNPESPLPSFLAAWPRVKRYDELPSWCSVILQRKLQYDVSRGAFGLTLGLSHLTNYDKEMRRLVQRFPSS